MTRIASIDGVIHAPDDAKVSIYDRGFLYGDSVFETVRTYAGEPFALDEHLARLTRSADTVGIAMPIDAEAMALEVRDAIRAAGNAESYARVMLTRGQGPVGLDPALARAPLRVILVEPLVPPSAALYRDGVAAVTARIDRAGDAAPTAKVGNYLGSLLALQRAQAAGAHEALVLDAGGRIVEGTTSNIFVVRARTLVTPPEDAGLLAGITRAHVLGLAKGLGLTVDIAPIPRDALATADEAFLTSSIRELLPVVRIDGAAIGDGRPGPVTRALHAAFRTHVGLAGTPMPWE